MTVTPKQITLASRQIAQDVGMFRIGDGEDPAVMEMARMLDLVRASLEMLAYDPWAVDLCASGFGAWLAIRLLWP